MECENMGIDYNQLSQAGNLLASLGNFGNAYNPLYGKHEVLTVNGLQEAKDFKLNKNERVALIDSNDDVLYIKECDEIGKYNLKIYACTDVTDKYLQSNTPASISKAEFENLKNDMSELKTMLSKVVNNGKHNV